VATNEVNAELTVKAISTVDNTKFGTARVTVKNDLASTLATAWNGETSSDPVSLAVVADLADSWTVILTAIQTSQKYVALDLSNCSMSGTEFDPGTANTGEGKIVSLVLPNTATSIKAGSEYDDRAFKNFTRLPVSAALL
jgi:hypothetical protein